MSKKTHDLSPSPSPGTASTAAESEAKSQDRRRGRAAGRDIADTCVAVGFALVTVFLVFGLVLESFHLVKLPFYLDIRLRRELWTLAHAHGTLMGAITILFGLSAERFLPRLALRQVAARLVMAGACLVPLGFLGGGIANAEGDPSLAILLVPTGALLAILGLGLLVRGAFKG